MTWGTSAYMSYVRTNKEKGQDQHNVMRTRAVFLATHAAEKRALKINAPDLQTRPLPTPLP